MGLCYTYNGATLLGHYAAPHKVALGWMAPANYQNVSSNGLFTLRPIESVTGGLQALRVERGPGSNQWLWLEYRQPIGYDTSFIPGGMSSQVYSGALIHFEDASDATWNGYTRLLNFSAAWLPGDFTQPALPAPTHWADPDSSLRIDITGASAAALNVSISYGDAGAFRPAGAGVFRSGTWVVDRNADTLRSGPASDMVVSLGAAADIPVTGDWNGDGRAKAGVFRNGLWVLDYNGNGQWDGPVVDRAFRIGTGR